MTMTTLKKDKHLTGVVYVFRGLVHYHHGTTWWHAGVHGAEKGAEISTSWPAGNRKWSELGLAWAWKTLKSTLTVTHILQQGHTYCNKATPPNSTTPYEIMGANYFQTTTAWLCTCVCVYVYVCGEHIQFSSFPEKIQDNDTRSSKPISWPFMTSTFTVLISCGCCDNHIFSAFKQHLSFTGVEVRSSKWVLPDWKSGFGKVVRHESFWGSRGEILFFPNPVPSSHPYPLDG